MDNGFENISQETQRNLIADIVRKKNGISDLDWSEICQKYDLDVSPETLRKAGVGIKLVADAGMFNDGGGTSISELSEGFVERQKLRDLNNKVKTVYRAEARDELLRENIIEAVRRLPSLFPVVRTAVPNAAPSERELVLCIGDVHYGANITVSGLYGEELNSFNSEIFDIRMRMLFDDVLNILDKEQIDKVHVFLVGDLIDGMLRASQLMKLEQGLVDSTMAFAEYMSNWINALSEHVSQISIAMCSGNHSEIRPLGSKKRQFPDENMERIIAWYMAARLAGNPRVDVDDSCRAYNLKEVLDYTFLLLHGDSEKDIKDVAREAVLLYGQPIDFFICGHKHRESEYPAGSSPDGNSTIIRVPSVCGADTYAQSKGYGGKAGATAIIMERGYGRRCVYPIILN